MFHCRALPGFLWHETLQKTTQFIICILEEFGSYKHRDVRKMLVYSV